MIISVVTETYWPEINGVALTLNRLVKGLAKRGNKIQLICPHVENRQQNELRNNIFYYPVKGLPVPGYKDANFGMPSTKHLMKLWVSYRPDVIYVATEGPLGWAAIKLANRLNIPVVSGFHTNFQAYCKHYKMGVLEKFVQRHLVSLHNKTKTTIVPTITQKNVLLEMGIENVSIMGRGVDTSLFSPLKRDYDLRSEWGAGERDPVIIYVGRIAEEKNLDLTIRTYYSLKKLNKNTKFVLVGKGPLEKKLKKDYPDFIFAGQKTGEELAAHYASGDIFLFSSLTETFGNVVMEAMASGLAIVAFDYAAAHMHIQREETGLLVSVENSDEFIQCAQRLLVNKFLQRKLRRNATQYSQTYSWPAIVLQFEKILLENSSVDTLEKGGSYYGLRKSG